MMDYILPILVVFSTCLLINLIFMLYRRRLVQNLIWAQLNGKSTSTFLVHFRDSSPEQLLYPLTPSQLAAIHACRSFERTTAVVKGIRPIEGLMSDLYFTVHYDICGVSGSGKSFTIQEDAYLRVCFLKRGSTIHWIVGSREPF